MTTIVHTDSPERYRLHSCCEIKKAVARQVLQLLRLRKEKLVLFPNLFLTEGTEVVRAGGMLELQECPALDVTDGSG